jgi:hypothetical protein
MADFIDCIGQALSFGDLPNPLFLFLFSWSISGAEAAVLSEAFTQEILKGIRVMVAHTDLIPPFPLQYAAFQRGPIQFRHRGRLCAV